MRIGLGWFGVWFVVASSAHAQSVPAYSLLRENEDWSFLRDTSVRQDIWDPLKYMRLGSDDWYLTIGGEVREVFEQVGNDNWGRQPYTNAFFLERYMLHSDWHLNPHFRAFVQLKRVWSPFGPVDQGRSAKRSSTSKPRSSRPALRAKTGSHSA